MGTVCCFQRGPVQGDMLQKQTNLIQSLPVDCAKLMQACSPFCALGGVQVSKLAVIKVDRCSTKGGHKGERRHLEQHARRFPGRLASVPLHKAAAAPASAGLVGQATTKVASLSASRPCRDTASI